MQEAAIAKGCPCSIDSEHTWLDAYVRDPDPATVQMFNDYVRCRWPIQVFALDPVTQDQNIADIFSRRRELQLALAVGVARGTVRANAAANFARRLETDIETIQLNRTSIAFAHGSDTFGWRFYPRFQSPPTPGSIGAFVETLTGGPRRNNTIRSRKIEPGQRDCVAVVLMPSFVPYVTVSSRANWFGLANPKFKEFTLHQTMKLSSAYAAIEKSAQEVCDCGAYRDRDAHQLLNVVQSIGERLPLQTSQVQVPFENTMGGFEMFSNGVTDLAPELHGFYGGSGVIVNAATSCTSEEAAPNKIGGNCEGTCNGTTLFLVGDGFSVHDTKVVAGGKCVPFILMSRQIMRVTIPENVKPSKQGDEEWIDVHVASPYGVSSHLHIPALTTPSASTVTAIVKRLEDLEVCLGHTKFTLAGPAPLEILYSTDATQKLVNLSPMANSDNFKIAPSAPLAGGDVSSEIRVGGALSIDGKPATEIRMLAVATTADKVIQLDSESVLEMVKPELEKLSKAQADSQKFGLRFYVVTSNGSIPQRVVGETEISLLDREPAE